MDDETLLLLGLGVAAIFIFKKEIGGLFQGPTTALTGAGNAIGQTGNAIGQVGTTAGNVISSDLNIFDIPKDIGMFVNFFQNLNPNNKKLGTW